MQCPRNINKYMYIRFQNKMKCILKRAFIHRNPFNYVYARFDAYFVCCPSFVEFIKLCYTKQKQKNYNDGARACHIIAYICMYIRTYVHACVYACTYVRLTFLSMYLCFDCRQTFAFCLLHRMPVCLYIYVCVLLFFSALLPLCAFIFRVVASCTF